MKRLARNTFGRQGILTICAVLLPIAVLAFTGVTNQAKEQQPVASVSATGPPEREVGKDEQCAGLKEADAQLSAHDLEQREQLAHQARTAPSKESSAEFSLTSPRSLAEVRRSGDGLTVVSMTAIFPGFTQGTNWTTTVELMDRSFDETIEFWKDHAIVDLQQLSIGLDEAQRTTIATTIDAVGRGDFPIVSVRLFGSFEDLLNFYEVNSDDIHGVSLGGRPPRMVPDQATIQIVNEACRA